MFKELVDPASGYARVGDVVEFRIIVRNTGETTLTQVGLADDWDAECLELVEAIPAPGYVDEIIGEMGYFDITTSLGDIPPGGEVVVTVRLRAISDTCQPVALNLSLIHI